MEPFQPSLPTIQNSAPSLPEPTRLDPPIREHGLAPAISQAEYGPSSSTKPTSDALQSVPIVPFSPPKPELDAHPIRQPLSTLGDGIVTGFGTAAPVVPLAVDRPTKPAEELVPVGESRVPDAMGDTTIKEGDAVSYAWGGDKKGGTVTEVATTGSINMETARGNTATKEAGHNDPALRLERAGHDVVKNASEVHKEKAGETHNEGGVHKTVGEEKKAEPKTGEKRSAEHVEEPKANGEEPKKKKGRPAKGGAGGAKKDVKKRPPKKAATESGEPRRSGRVAAKSS